MNAEFWSQTAWKFSTNGGSIPSSVGNHGNFTRILAMLYVNQVMSIFYSGATTTALLFSSWVGNG